MIDKIDFRGGKVTYNEFNIDSTLPNEAIQLASKLNNDITEENI